MPHRKSTVHRAGLLELGLWSLLGLVLSAGAGELPSFDVPGAQARCYTCSDRFTDLRRAADGARVLAASDGGVLEFGTNGEFRAKYTRQDGLCGHGVRELLPAPDGRLWVATTAGVGERAAGQWASHTRRQGLNDDCVYALAADGKGRVYAGTERGISRFSGVRFEPFDDTHEFGRKPTYGICGAPDGSLWFAKENALTRCRADGKWETFQRDPFRDDKLSRLTGKWLLCVATDEMGRPWIGTTTGVGCFDAGGWMSMYDAERFFRGRGLLSSRIVTLACETNGWLWIGHGDVGRGMTRFRGDDWGYLSAKDGLPSDDVYRVRCDESGGAWLATGKGGCYVNDGHFIFYRPVSELADNHVVAIRMTSNRLVAVQTVTGTAWFERGERLIEAAVSAGAAFLPATVSAIEPAMRIAGIRDVVPRVQLKGADGRTWLGTRDEGLLCLDGAQWRRVLLNGLSFPREITCLSEEAPGVLWVGTASEGAMRLELDSGGRR